MMLLTSEVAYRGHLKSTNDTDTFNSPLLKNAFRKFFQQFQLHCRVDSQETIPIHITDDF